MSMLKPIVDKNGGVIPTLKRDTFTGAVIIDDANGFNKYNKQRELELTVAKQSEDIAEMKQILLQILSKLP